MESTVSSSIPTQALDKIHELGDLTDGNLQSARPMAIPHSQGSSPRHAPTTGSSPRHAPAAPTLGEDHPNSYLFDEVDVSIRVAFVQFLFDPELLGHIDQHLCIYRLFPRPVVALRNAAFMTAYKATSGTADISFIKELIKTQVILGVALAVVWWVWHLLGVGVALGGVCCM